MININKHTLDNGLRVVHCQDSSTQMVALNVLYDVGARDEDPAHTGFAHLFEHLMFSGSVNIPDYDEPVQTSGGENNAWTNNDITNYYITLPYSNVEIGFWLESDRMLSLDFNEKGLEVQRQVVMEEFKQTSLNQPYGDVSHLMRSLAYEQHPYQWPTIGKELSHIAQATMDEVKQFFFSHYAPNNAILAVTGNISFEETIRFTEKWFGPIERRAIRPRQLPKEPKQTALRRMEVEREVPVDGLYMAFHMPDRRHADYHTYDMISDILSNGASSRLIQRLVKQQRIFTTVDASIMGSIDEGLFYINGKPAEGVSLEAAERAVWEELEVMKAEEVSDFELEKVKNKYESQQIFSNMNYLNLASELAFHELLGDAERINQEVENYRKVDKAQIRRVANALFDEANCNILYYKAKQ